MRALRSPPLPKLKDLGNISWLSAAQFSKLTHALTVVTVEKHGIIHTENGQVQGAAVLLSGVARITSLNRKGQRALVVMIAPGMIPGFPTAVSGVSYKFRCEAVTQCRVGTLALRALVAICLGTESNDFSRMAVNYIGRWDLIQLRHSNFMNYSLEERLALLLLELCTAFGVSDRDGVRLTVRARHVDLAEMVGASRPRVTEHLIGFIAQRMIVKRASQMIVRPDRLRKFLARAHPKSNHQAQPAARLN